MRAAGTRLAAILLVAGCASGPARAPTSPPRRDQPGPALGTPVDEVEIAAWDLDVSPDGTGLPPGSGSAAEGAALYAKRCAHCHGAGGRGGPADTLTGDATAVGAYWPYATTLFDYLRRSMPYEAPGSLENDELYALTAWVLHLDGIVSRDQRLDRESLPQIAMPNRDGFHSEWWPIPPEPSAP
jgi:cytochrome c